MVLLRRVLGDALRSRRLDQDRTLRDVSTAANVSLGYLSEIERGQKEASSELLASICDALETRLSEVLREASGTMALAEEMAEMLEPAEVPAGEAAGDGVRMPEAKLSTSIELSIDPPAGHPDNRRDVVCAA
ncbi:MAG: helix-turn-helix domain-containing protein [Micromonosporaceae bacterium]